jgi:hypothetical protein
MSDGRFLYFMSCESADEGPAQPVPAAPGPSPSPFTLERVDARPPGPELVELSMPKEPRT